MAQELTFEYDRVGDILYVQTCPPYAEQESDELGDEMVGRFHPDTGALECVEILFFTKRFERRKTINVPFSVDMRPRPSRARRPAPRRASGARRG
jgi:hypothetical protein